MNKIGIGQIWDDRFATIIRDLVSKSSMFKTRMYKSLLMNETISSAIVKEYLNYVDGFINLWNNFSDELTDKIKETKAVVPNEGNRRVVNIENVKEYIYSSYDYASILQLADGILEGISKKKFTESENIKDFKDTVAEKALNTDGSEVADVLDDALNKYTFSEDLVVCDTSAVTRFNSLTRTKIFDSKDAKVLFKAIDKTIQFLAGNNMEKYVSRSNMKLYISALNGILDYITLSLTVFAVRPFIIDKYARSFYLYTKEAVEANVVHESYDDYEEFIEYEVADGYEEFDEKSHGKLKFDFRLAKDAWTGHDLKIVYSTDGMELTQNNVVGDDIGNRVPKGGATDAAEVAKLKRYGNTDHQSKNQKVLAIIDLKTGKKLKKATCKGPFGYNREKIKLKVGEVDPNPLFKSTYWDPRPGKNSIQDISTREGHHIRGMQAARVTDTDKDGKLYLYHDLAKSNHHNIMDNIESRNLYYHKDNLLYTNILDLYNSIIEDLKKQSKELNTITPEKLGAGFGDMRDLYKSSTNPEVMEIIQKYEKSLINFEYDDFQKKVMIYHNYDKSYTNIDHYKETISKIPKFTSIKYKSNTEIRQAQIAIEKLINSIKSKINKLKSKTYSEEDLKQIDSEVEKESLNQVKKSKEAIRQWRYNGESVESEEDEDTPKVDKPDVEKSGSASDSNNVETRIIIDADDTTCRDIFKIEEFFDMLYEFIQNIGAMHDETVNLRYTDYCCYYNPSKNNEDNLFGKRLISNPVIDIINKNTLGYIEGSNAYAKINEVNQMLKEITYNSHQGLEGSYSPKNEIMHVIRGTEPESQTIEGYQRLALDLYKYSILLLRPFNTTYRNISDWKSKERVEGDYSLATTNLMSECAKIVSEIYRDLSMTVLQKARDIETQINNLKNVEIDKVFSTIKLDVFKPKSEDITDAHMTTMVPNTTPMSVDLMDLYTLPAFESYQMYDDYLRTLPEFVNNTYLSEDFDMSALMNNIMAALTGLLNGFAKFFQNPGVQGAFNYVKNNKDTLLALDFDGVNGLEVLPYLENINLAYVSTFSKSLNNFSADKDLASDEAMKKFVVSLYPNEEIYNLFNGDNANKKNAKEAFKNYVLFGKTSDIQNKKLKTRAEIQKELAMWIQTIEQGPALFELIKKWVDEMNQTIKSFKSKVTNASSDTSTSTSTTTTQTNSTTQNNNKDQSPPSMNTSGTNGTQNTQTQSQEQNQTNQNDTSNNTDNKSQSISKVIGEVQKAQLNVILPIQGIVFQVIRDEYKYIQEAYQIGKKPTKVASQNNT